MLPAEPSTQVRRSVDARGRAIPMTEQEIRERAEEAIRTLDSLDEMGDEEEQRQTLDALMKALDEEGISEFGSADDLEQGE